MGGHALTPTALAQGRRGYTCTSASGHALEVDVIGSETGGLPRPCVLWIHGGGLIFGSRTISPRPSFAQALLKLGFIVASVDHRLAPETKLPDILDDITELWRWLHESGPDLFGVDARRVCIAGASAGAYLSLLAGCRFSPKPRAVASFWGFGDITAPWEADPSEHYRKAAPEVTRADALASLRLTPVPTASGEDRSTFYLYCRQQGRWLEEVTGHALPQDEAWLREYCPLHHIASDFPPAALVHGCDDTDVPVAESDHLAAMLRSKGVDHVYHCLPGTGHGFAGASAELVLSTEQAVAEFLYSHVEDKN